MEIATKPLVMASKIAGLEALSGFIKQENRVVPVKFAYVKKGSFQPEYIERKMTIPGPGTLPPVTLPMVLANVTTTPTLIAAPGETAPKREIEKLVPVANLRPALPLFEESVSDEVSKPEQRRSAFKRNEGASREWKPVD
jgi:hypothetical protein